MFMMVSTVEAKNGENLPNRIGINNAYNNYNDAVNFFERGIEFFVFTNGDFDFDSRFNNRGLRINRDFNGRIRNVGNVFINYDFRGNVTRIGSVFIRYSRGLLTNVGDLRVRYDRWNYPVFYGNVRDFYYNNGVRFNISFGDVCDYNDAYFYRNDFGRNYTQFREDNNFYYYRANSNARIGKRSTILKRRKPASATTNRKYTKRGTSNSYRKTDSNRRETSNRTVTDSRRKSDKNKVVRRNNNTTDRKVDTKRKTINRFDRSSETKRNSSTTSRNDNTKRKTIYKSDRSNDVKRKSNTTQRKSDVNKRDSKTERKRRG